MKPLSLLLIILSLSLVVASAFAGYRTLYARSSTPETEAAHVTSERGPVRMIRFVLLDDGIYPRSMNIDEGLVNIALQSSRGVLVDESFGHCSFCCWLRGS